MITRHLALMACALPLAQGFMPRPSKQVGGVGAPSTTNKANNFAPSPSSPSSSLCRPTTGYNGNDNKKQQRINTSTRLASTTAVDDEPSDVEVDAASFNDDASYSSPSSLKDNGSVAPGSDASSESASSTWSTTSTRGSSFGGSVKDTLIETIAGGLLNFASPTKRAAVNELLIKLEALNPTDAPASSPLLNGAWEFLYTGGISPGILGLQLASRVSSMASGAVEVGDTILTISRAQPRVEVQTSLKVFGRENKICIRTKLEAASDLRLEETYVEASMGTLRVPFPDQDRFFSRPLFVSYLDEDLLVVRDAFGAPDILIRREKDFNYFTGVPSTTDDDTSPGAG